MYEINIIYIISELGRSGGQVIAASTRGAKQGGELGGSQPPPPPEFWIGGLNTCQTPLILRRFLLRGVGPVGSP